jgi:hypothetical protein
MFGIWRVPDAADHRDAVCARHPQRPAVPRANPPDGDEWNGDGRCQPLDARRAHALLGCAIADDVAPDGKPQASEADVADALEQLVFATSDEVLCSDERRFEEALAQIDRFADDRQLLQRRRHAKLANRVESAQRDLERASGAQQRTDAEKLLRELREEVEEVEEKIARLESRDDEAYQRYREQAQARRYAEPRVERLLEADLRIE